MRTIYKYDLEPAGVDTEIRLPPGSRILYAAVQSHVMCIWIERDLDVHPDEVLETHIFVTIGTDISFEYPDKTFEYIGTVFQGPFVWHVYHGRP